MGGFTASFAAGPRLRALWGRAHLLALALLLVVLWGDLRGLAVHPQRLCQPDEPGLKKNSPGRSGSGR